MAYARMKYELENRSNRSLLGKAVGPFAAHPDMTPAAKSGTPQMTGFRPTIPASVPALPPAPAHWARTMSASPDPVSRSNAIDKDPDVARQRRRRRAAPAGAGRSGEQPTTPTQPAPARVTGPGRATSAGMPKATSAAAGCVNKASPTQEERNVRQALRGQRN